MIQTYCACGQSIHAPETEANRDLTCGQCGRLTSLVCTESLSDGAGGGDFDGYLEIITGPDQTGRRIYAGGCSDIDLGKQDGCAVRLPGKMVSRRHCRLVRVDFGPSRWKICDNRSTNGLFVNGQRVDEHELATGDVVRVGEYELEFGIAAAPAPVAPPRPAAPAGPACPSCGTRLTPIAKICVHCGVNLKTGKALTITQDVDENYVHANAHTAISFISWIMPVTLFPMPLISQAYGKYKPVAIKSIAWLTVAASVIFLLATWSQSETESEAGASTLMLQPPTRPTLEDRLAKLPRKTVDGLIAMLDKDEKQVYDKAVKEMAGKYSEAEARRRGLAAVLRAADEGEEPPAAKFHAYQLITHTFLHDNSSVLGFIFHLGGNLLFLLVFGTRVNALIGNVATAIIYPVLAVAAAGAHLLLGNPTGPMLGASGAINGLAGMYLVLFPTALVYCAMWLRLRWWLIYKVFLLRGFWVLGIYVAYDLLMVWFQNRAGITSGTAHWAHLGGFGVGAMIALGLLFSRQFNMGGGDLLSVVLGKHAWPLIGKPGQWAGEK